MPWAGGFPAFQAVFAKLEKLEEIILADDNSTRIALLTNKD
jgi:hypothetical protein